jgi:hypothetical protein
MAQWLVRCILTEGVLAGETGRAAPSVSAHRRRCRIGSGLHQPVEYCKPMRAALGLGFPGTRPKQFPAGF